MLERLRHALPFLLIALTQTPACAQSPAELPLPTALSPEIRSQLETYRKTRAAGPQMTWEQLRHRADEIQSTVSAEQAKKFPVTIEETTLGGVPVRRIRPKTISGAHKVLLNLHGGGFILDSGSLTENIPLASMTGIPVIAVRYRLAPEHPFPAALDDAVAVYRELLKSYKPEDIAVYGTSAGAILGPQLMVRLRMEKLPMPAALGVFSGDADLGHPGDSTQLYPLNVGGLDLAGVYRNYAPGADLADPKLSALSGQVADFPPTLCLTSTRDFLLSSTAYLCRRLARAQVDARLIVFDGLPHAFWAYLIAPESDEAFEAMARFFTTKLHVAERR